MQIFHCIKKYEPHPDFPKNIWVWAIMWKEKVVCFTDEEEKAEEIVWALDKAMPYFEE